MPLYEYECTACHKRTEKIQKFSDPEITVCPKCGGVLERVITAPAIAFKGGGWYADGYGNAKPTAAASGDGGGADGKGPEGKSSEGKSSEGQGSEKKAAAGNSAAAASAPAAAAPASAAAAPASAGAASKV